MLILRLPLVTNHNMNSAYDNERPHRRHYFGWIILGLFAALIVGSFLFWGIGLATGFYPLGFYRPYFFFPFGFLIFILFIFFVFRFAFWGWWGWGWRRRGYYGNYYDAKEILRMRYARGEITKEQFDQMMRDIEEKK
jgi:uncharacterized membrane protein